MRPDMDEYPGEADLTYWLSSPSACSLGFVYVLRCTDDGPVKVGRARDVPARIKTLQTGNPYTLKPIYVIPGSHRLETALHRRFIGARLQGEWFHGPRVPIVLSFVAQLSEWMKERYEATDRAKLPNFADFDANYLSKPKGMEGMTVRYVDPEPLTEQEMAANMQKRPWVRKLQRDKRIFQAAQGEPNFVPHKR